MAENDRSRVRCRLSSGGGWRRLCQGDDRFHFDGRTQGQGGHLDRAPGRVGLLKVLAVYTVDALEVTEVGEEHSHLDGVAEAAARLCGNRGEIAEDLVRLGTHTGQALAAVLSRGA